MCKAQHEFTKATQEQEYRGELGAAAEVADCGFAEVDNRGDDTWSEQTMRLAQQLEIRQALHCGCTMSGIAGARPLQDKIDDSITVETELTSADALKL